MQSVVILRALELSASKVSLSWLVFWWLTCVSVLFDYFIYFISYYYYYYYYFILFIIFFSVVLRFFECFSFLVFSYWVYLLILSMRNQYPLLAFKVCLHSRLSFVQSHLRLFCFSAIQSHNLHTVTQESLNVKGLSNFRKKRTIFLWCRKCKADQVFLQETHSIAATENQWRNEWGAEVMSSHGSSNARGAAILFKNGIDFSINHKIVDPEGRYIILKACSQDKVYVLINAYAPNKR